jgi:hypothetical protein
MTIRLDATRSKSYANEENLMKALNKMNLLQFKPFIVRNVEGRWTAIFSVATIDRFSGNPMYAVNCGFFTSN